MTGREDTVHRILEEVAEAENTDKLELPPLGNTIDGDAVEKVLDSSDQVSVEFDYAGYELRVTNDDITIQ